MALQTTISKGECEVCGTPDVKLRLQKLGNIMMCESCWADEQATVSANAKAVILTSQKIDSTIQLKADIFNATTTSFTELQAAILADDSIPADKKAETLLTRVAARMEVLNAAIFAENAALVAKQNERNALLKSAQEVHARLRESERAKFKQFDVNYKPAAVKVSKPKGDIKPKKARFIRSELMAAAAESGLPASAIRTRMVSSNMTAKEAADYILKSIQ